MATKGHVAFLTGRAVGMALTQMATIAASVYSRRTLAPRALAVHPVADL